MLSWIGAPGTRAPAIKLALALALALWLAAWRKVWPLARSEVLALCLS